MNKIPAAWLLFLISILSCSEKNSIQSGGLSSQESLAAFRLPEGFKIELVASEPLIADPVAMEVDENGDIYVVEMHGYPLDTKGSGVIKLLKDTNDDGAPDEAVIFADQLSLPSGIMRWKKGFLVIDVPNILYLEDSNNDGKADIKKVLITGLAVTNPQHIANTPIYGLDNWIYVAHQRTVTPRVAMEFNDTGSKVRYVNYPNAVQLPRDADGRNIRFKPGTYELEILSGESQYGHTFDTWGHHFGTSNADHLFHDVIEAKYLQRNPVLMVNESAAHIPDHGEAAEIYPITKNPQHQLLTDIGVITSSCGVTWYQGGLFPDSFNNVSFIAEPVHNLVHTDRITGKGASFTAARVYQKKEFLASEDPWFRPVQFYTGPDGALYVIDYYRQIIEHPEWMSDSINKSGALYNGSDKGRIYRITPTGTEGINWCGNIKLGTASIEKLVQSLGNKNIWWRRHAQRLLLEKKGSNSIDILKNFIDTASSAAGIVHALWTLQGLHSISEAALLNSFKNPAEGVRENAIKIAELNLKNMPRLQEELMKMEADPSAKVRFQLLCTLGELKDTTAEMVRQKLWIKDIEDPWVQIATLTSSAGRELTMIQNAIPVFGANKTEGKVLFFKNCSSIIGLSQKSEDIKKLIRLATNKYTTDASWWQIACLSGLSSSIRDKGLPTADFNDEKQLLLSTFSTTTDPFHRAASIGLLKNTGIHKNQYWNHAVKLARSAIANKKAEPKFREDAIGIIAMEKNLSDTSLLIQLLNPAEAESMQKAALFACNELAPQTAAGLIVRNWETFTYNIRDAALEILLSTAQHINSLLNAVEKKQIQPSSINWPRTVSLMNNDDEATRSRARALLSGGIEDRDVVYKKYEPALSMQGEAANGLAVFKRTCSSCHQVGGKNGKAFGPDLASIRNRDIRFIMADILNPNRSIADRYELWTLEKTNGEKLSGIIASETSSAIVLHNAAAEEIIIPRREIKKMQATETSAMPAGLEATFSIKEMADILAYLKNIH